MSVEKLPGNDAAVLAVGVIVDAGRQSPYVVDLLEYLVASEAFAAPIVFPVTAGAQPDQVLALSSLTRWVRRIEFGQMLGKQPAVTRRIAIDDIDGLDIVPLAGEWSADGATLDVFGENLEAIIERRLDILVHLASGRPGAGLASAADLATLAIYHGSDCAGADVSLGFMEVLEDAPASCFVIARANPFRVLQAGNIMTAKSWALNQAMLMGKSITFMRHVLERIANDRALLEVDTDAEDALPATLPSTGSLALARYMANVLMPVVLRKFRTRLFGRRDREWVVAVSDHRRPGGSLDDYREIPNPDGRFLADPFLCSRDGRHIVFVEDYCYRDNRGRISAVELGEEGAKVLGVIIDEPWHLSFPFVFEYKGRLYMIPEANESGAIRLYVCDEFPLHWRFEKTLMADVAAADTMVFERDGTWFLLTNICSAGLGDFNSELHIFHADDPLTTDWHPIGAGNPVILDSSRARNGGWFIDDGQLFRINQIHAKNHYGRAFGFNRVDELSRKRYRETRIGEVWPCDSRGFDSTHHFNADGARAVIDFCRLDRARK
ncbi:MAG: hypothetical protein CSB44_12855 [Gammaproteobacteria bacterium]|nr:MAG: hypothetical protein CSB44_12855 [Gammaproteobacteria bacterium]